MKLTEGDVQSALDEQIPNRFKVKSKYVNKDTPLEVLCLECNNTINLTYNNIRSNKFSCMYCKKTYGEELVSSILESMGFKYTYLYNAGPGRSLEFDFSIEVNGKQHFIEYDGRQHFIPIFGSSDEERESNLENQILRDSKKDEWCKENEFPLLRLPYTLSKDEIINKINSFLN